MRNLTNGLGFACLLWAGAAHAQDPGCEDFRTLALMPSATVATHERGADPNWFDDSQKLSDLTLLGAPCTIDDQAGDVQVICLLKLTHGVPLDSFFDAVDQCLKDNTKKLSRADGDYVWTSAGSMVKTTGLDDGRVNVTFVYGS